MLQKCFGESTLSRTQVFEWHKALSEGREVVENLPYASTSVNDNNIEKVKKIVLENRRVRHQRRSRGSQVLLWIDSTHCGSYFGYEARRRQTTIMRRHIPA